MKRHHHRATQEPINVAIAADRNPSITRPFEGLFLYSNTSSTMGPTMAASETRANINCVIWRKLTEFAI